jgi:hypothetical protein
MAGKRHGGRGDHRRKQNSTRPHASSPSAGCPRSKLPPGARPMCRSIPLQQSVSTGRARQIGLTYLVVEALASLSQPFAVYWASVGFNLAQSALVAALLLFFSEPEVVSLLSAAVVAGPELL